MASWTLQSGADLESKLATRWILLAVFDMGLNLAPWTCNLELIWKSHWSNKLCNLSQTELEPTFSPWTLIFQVDLRHTLAPINIATWCWPGIHFGPWTLQSGTDLGPLRGRLGTHIGPVNLAIWGSPGIHIGPWTLLFGVTGTNIFPVNLCIWDKPGTHDWWLTWDPRLSREPWYLGLTWKTTFAPSTLLFGTDLATTMASWTLLSRADLGPTFIHESWSGADLGPH